MRRSFLVVWFGQIVSTLGTMVSGFGAAIWVFDETRSYLWLGLLSAAVMGATVAASPLLGMVDRFDRRHVMLAADTAAAVTTLGAVAVWWFGDLEPWHLAVAGVAGGFTSAFQGPAYAAAIPDLVEADELERANGLVQLGPAVSIVLGPAIAGAALGLFGIGAVLAIDLGTFIIGALTVAAVPFQSRPEPEPGDDLRMRTAARWLWLHGRPYALMIGAMASVNFGMGIFNVTSIGLAVELGGLSRAGLPATAGGVAMIAVGGVLGARGLPRRRMRAIALGLGWFGALLVVSVARPNLWLLVISLGLAFAALPVVQATTNTLFHEGVPRAMQGRVFGFRSAVGQGTTPIGALLAGPLAGWSAAGSLTITGLGLIICGFLVAISPTLRGLPDGADPVVAV